MLRRLSLMWLLFAKEGETWLTGLSRVRARYPSGERCRGSAPCTADRMLVPTEANSPEHPPIEAWAGIYGVGKGISCR